MKDFFLKFLPVFFFVSFLPAFSQEIEDEKVVREKKHIYKYIDFLVDRATIDINRAIEEGVLKEKVAMVNFNYLGDDSIENKHREYLLKSIEAIYQENKFFHFIKSVEALNRAQVNYDLKKIEFVNVEDKDKIIALTKELNATQYAVINLTLKSNKLELAIIIRSLDHSIIWADKWTTAWRSTEWFILLGLYPGMNLELEEFPIYLEFSIGKTFFVANTKLNLMLFVDLGASFINVNNESDFTTNLQFIYGLGIEVDILELAKVNYTFLELLLSFRLGLFSLNTTTDDFDLNFSAIPLLTTGITFVFVSDYYLFFDVNIMPFIDNESVDEIIDIFFSLGFKYRFDL